MPVPIVGSALVLGLLGEATKQILDLIREKQGMTSDRRASTFVPSGTALTPKVLAGSGGVRAPPSL